MDENASDLLLVLHSCTLALSLVKETKTGSVQRPRKNGWMTAKISAVDIQDDHCGPVPYLMNLLLVPWKIETWRNSLFDERDAEILQT